MKKKNKKKAKPKASPRKTIKHEIVVRVAPPEVIPTTEELAVPLTDKGGNLTIVKTWVSSKQIMRLVEKTPPAQVYKRPGKGGKTWDYVTVSYVQRVLDFTFGFNWDFDVVEHGKEADHVWVLGRLTVRNPQGTQSIVKTQFGRSEVKHKKEGGMLDYGNDLKAATSDALKKCASMLGIARDIYGKTDYKQESGVTPRENGERVIQTLPAGPAEAIKTTSEKYEPVVCKGIKGKGCTYGNDAEPLSKEVAEYSKKMYGKPLCKECQKDAKQK